MGYPWVSAGLPRLSALEADRLWTVRPLRARIGGWGGCLHFWGCPRGRVCNAEPCNAMQRQRSFPLSRAYWSRNSSSLPLQVCAELIGNVHRCRNVGDLIAKVGVLVVRIIGHPIVKMVDTVSEHAQPALKPGDRSGGLRVACFDQTDLLGYVAEMERMDSHAINLSAAVLLKQNQGAMIIVHALDLQFWDVGVHACSFLFSPSVAGRAKTPV